MKPVACKHLDYTDGKYEDCEIKTCAPQYPHVRYWKRGERWTDNVTDRPNPQNVQFCGQGRGRINSIFDCYTGALSCYEQIKGSDAASSEAKEGK